MARGQSRAVVLVGHGGVPKDFPRERLMELKRLERERRSGEGRGASSRELELDGELRNWPRTDATDPYRAGLRRIAEALATRLDDAELVVAYNEFCAPSVSDAIEDAIARGATHVVVIPTMLTPGGSHSEVDIPETLAEVRARHAGVEIVYAWPFEPAAVAEMLAARVRAATEDP